MSEFVKFVLFVELLRDFEEVADAVPEDFKAMRYSLSLLFERPISPKHDALLFSRYCLLASERSNFENQRPMYFSF